MLSDLDEPSGGGRRIAIFATCIMGLVAILSAADMIGDFEDHVELEHLLFEGLTLLLGAVGLVAGFIYLGVIKREQARLRVSLGEARAEAREWREEAQAALLGLGQAIDAQFTRWGLTPAEAEVGLLLLKGLSFKELGEVRGVSERTVRQQAQAVYKKAGVAGRAEFSAFFLEDLLLPSGSAGSAAAHPYHEPRTGS